MTYPSTATIRRAKTDNKYFQMHRDTAQDKTLSWEARGVIAYILSKPDNWDIQVHDLMQGCQKGRVYRILDELKAAGYLQDRKKYRDDKGKWQWSPYILHERPITNIIPMPEQTENNPYPEKQDTDSPYPDFRDTEKRDTENAEIKEHITDSQNKDNKKDIALAAQTVQDVKIGTVRLKRQYVKVVVPTSKSVTANQPTKPDTKLLAEAISKRLNMHKGREWNIAHMLQGTATKGDYKLYGQHFAAKPVSAETFNRFMDYFERECKDCSLAKPETIADWFGKFEAAELKRTKELDLMQRNVKRPLNYDQLVKDAS